MWSYLNGQVDGANLKKLVVQRGIRQHTAALDRLHWLLRSGRPLSPGGGITIGQPMCASNPGCRCLAVILRVRVVLLTFLFAV